MAEKLLKAKGVRIAAKKVANDVLVFACEKGDYKKNILPFTVLRRIDVLLEESKEKD